MTKDKEKHKSGSRNTVQKANSFVFGAVYYGIRIFCFLSGVRVKTVSKVEKLEKPSIVLCNHGSFVDFIFLAPLLRKYKPNFIIARLYFYNKYLRWILKSIGGCPKSMFAMDMESTKNCLRVLKSNGILAMMPEARLSTTGRFEDVQSNTYTFIKKSAVPVYTVKFSGDYFAKILAFSSFSAYNEQVKKGNKLEEIKCLVKQKKGPIPALWVFWALA